MKLEIGKRYMTRNQQTVTGPLEACHPELPYNNHPYSFCDRASGLFWTKSGICASSFKKGALDLTEEVGSPALNLESGREYYWTKSGLNLDKHHELDLVSRIRNDEPVTTNDELAQANALRQAVDTEQDEIPNPLSRFTKLEAGKRYVDRDGEIVTITSVASGIAHDMNGYDYNEDGTAHDGENCDLLYEWDFPYVEPVNTDLATVEDNDDMSYPYLIRQHDRVVALLAHKDDAQTLADALNA